jgi:Sec-independent protein translocase protein TatA
MQTPPPVGSPLSILLLILGIFLFVRSPKKLQTLGRMALAFIVTCS